MMSQHKLESTQPLGGKSLSKQISRTGIVASSLCDISLNVITLTNEFCFDDSAMWKVADSKEFLRY